MDYFLQSLNGGNIEQEKSVDTPLWFIYAIQQLKDHISFDINSKILKSIKSILDNYYTGTDVI